MTLEELAEWARRAGFYLPPNDQASSPGQPQQEHQQPVQGYDQHLFDDWFKPHKEGQ